MARKKTVKFSKSTKKAWRKTKRAGRKNDQKYNHSMVKFGFGLPAKCMVTHKYVNTFPLSAVGAFSYQVFCANGMYNPDVSLLGPQPMYFDQLSALYDHYVVIGSKMTVKILPQAITNSPSMIVLSKNDDNAPAFTTNQDAVAQTGATSVTIPTGYSGKNATLSQSYKAKKTYGGSILGNPLLRGDATTNPTETSTYILSASAFNLSTNASFYFEVIIDYIAIWTELKDITQS